MKTISDLRSHELQDPLYLRSEIWNLRSFEGVHMSDPMSDASRDSLKHLRQGLLRLHKMLLDLERVGYERAHHRIGNSYEFLQLVLKDIGRASCRERV